MYIWIFFPNNSTINCDVEMETFGMEKATSAGISFSAYVRSTQNGTLCIHF